MFNDPIWVFLYPFYLKENYTLIFLIAIPGHSFFFPILRSFFPVERSCFLRRGKILLFFCRLLILDKYNTTETGSFVLLIFQVLQWGAQLFWDVAILRKLPSLLLVRQAGAEVTVLSLFVLRGRGVGDKRMLFTARPPRWERASLFLGLFHFLVLTAGVKIKEEIMRQE